MTKDDFYYDYNENTEAGVPFGGRVYDLAYRIIPDMGAASQIRDEVMEIGVKHADEFEAETAWGGSGNWQGLEKLTRSRCIKMIIRPKSENPLAKQTLKQWGDDPWALSIGKLSFKHRQVFLLGVAFSGSARSIYTLLNKMRAKSEKKITQKKIKNLQIESSALMVESLTECYSL